MCELLVFRDPNSDQLCLIARTNTHKQQSAIAFSENEGVTWSKPQLTPGALTGDRHKMAQDPISGRFVISFREIQLVTDTSGKVTQGKANDFVAWVGTYDQLIKGEQGDYRIRLLQDFGERGQRSHGDNGYAGNVVTPDGTFVIDTYGIFDANTPSGDGNKVMSVHFKLGEIENEHGLVDREPVRAAIRQLDGVDPAMADLLRREAARADVQQVELDRLVSRAMRMLGRE